MTSKRNVSVTVGILLLLAGGMFMFNANSAKADGFGGQIQSTLSPIVSVLINRADGTSETVNAVGVTAEPTLGSVSGPDLYSPYFNVNGVVTYYYRTAMNQASTTCSFKSPAATSTLRTLDAYLAFASGATVPIEIGNSTSPNATTTLIAVNESASATSLIQATTTGSSLTDNIIAPNTYINVKVGSTSPTVRGTCQAVLMAI